MKTHRLLTLALTAICSAAAANVANATTPPAELPHKNHVHPENIRELAAIHFALNSDHVTDRQYEVIYDMARWLKANPGSTVVVTGYADAGTGTPAWNHALSERRAVTVADDLEYLFGIDPSQIIVEFDGSAVQPYADNDANRAAVFTIENVLTAEN